MPASTPAGADFRTLPEKVAGELREKILLGSYPPGAPIHERETAAELGVSRTPLREALRILANEGLVSIRAARSPVVTNPSAQEVGELYAVMRVLEALAGELACAVATPAQLESVRAAHEALYGIDPAKDSFSFFKADQAFHAAIVAGTGNPALQKTHAEYNARLWRARYMTARVHTDRDRILHDHAQILRGMEARDTHWVVTALESHLRSASIRSAAILAGGGNP